MELHGEHYNNSVPGPVDILHVPWEETKQKRNYIQCPLVKKKFLIFKPL